jgi:hypothetical protein
MIWLAKPQHSDGRSPNGEHLVYETDGHFPVARRVQRDVQMVPIGNQYASGPKGSGPMINKAVSIRIMSIRCAWRHGYQDLLRHGRKDNRLTGMLSLGVPKTYPLKIGIPLRRSTPPS